MNSTKKNLTEVGKFLRKLRFEHDESQEDMAKRLGIATPYISLLEGKQGVTKKLAVKIINVYNLTGKDKELFINLVSQDIINRFWGK